MVILLATDTMNIDKISEERLFQNNSKEEISRWGKGLQYFHYMRARGGHNCEGDSFCVYFLYNDREDLIDKLSKIGISLITLEEGFISYDPTKSYSFDDLDKLKVTIGPFSDLEQPQHVSIFGKKVHVWVLDNCFEVSVSGSKDNALYRVSESDFEACLELEKQFDALGWKNILDENIKTQSHCISERIYPELF